MKNLGRGLLLGGAAMLLTAPLAFGQLTDAEFKCERAAVKAGSKFVGSKSKCGIKCITNAHKGLNPSSDCFAPYGGATLTCVSEPTFRKGAEEKFEDGIRKACDPTFKVGTDCPECYDSGGDCATYASDRVQNVEGQVDSFGPGVFCDQDGTTPPNADDAETACELNTAKTLSKLVGALNKCYDKCFVNARKGLINASTCNPPASDPATAACINTAEGKSVAGVDKKCGDVGVSPDCAGVPNSYPNGASWTNLVDVAISGNIPGEYCASPSGAFVE